MTMTSGTTSASALRSAPTPIAHPDSPARCGQAGGDSGRGGLAQIQDRHRRAGLGQRTSHRAPEGSASPGHDRDAAGKIEKRRKAAHLSTLRSPSYRI